MFSRITSPQSVRWSIVERGSPRRCSRKLSYQTIGEERLQYIWRPIEVDQIFGCKSGFGKVQSSQISARLNTRVTYTSLHLLGSVLPREWAYPDIEPPMPPDKSIHSRMVSRLPLGYPRESMLLRGGLISWGHLLPLKLTPMEIATSHRPTSSFSSYCTRGSM